MPQLLELVIVAFLLLIAVELLLIYREIMRSQIHRKPSKEETAGGGQTINVTVGTPSAGQGAVVVAQDASQAKPGESALAKENPPEPEPEPPKPAPPPVTRSTSSGLIAKKCPSCGSENSSYRSECFNCGSRL